MCTPVNGSMNIFTDHVRNYFLGADGSTRHEDVMVTARFILTNEMTRNDGSVDRAIQDLAMAMKNMFLNGFDVRRNHRINDKGFTLVATDLMIAAIDRVDWRHIAEQMIESVCA